MKVAYMEEEKLNMTLGQYKESVFQCLTQKLNCTIPVAERLMKDYEEDFKGFLEQNLPPNAAAVGIAMNLL